MTNDTSLLDKFGRYLVQTYQKRDPKNENKSEGLHFLILDAFINLMEVALYEHNDFILPLLASRLYTLSRQMHKK